MLPDIVESESGRSLVFSGFEDGDEVTKDAIIRRLKAELEELKHQLRTSHKALQEEQNAREDEALAARRETIAKLKLHEEIAANLRLDLLKEQRKKEVARGELKQSRLFNGFLQKSLADCEERFLQVVEQLHEAQGLDKRLKDAEQLLELGEQLRAKQPRAENRAANELGEQIAVLVKTLFQPESKAISAFGSSPSILKSGQISSALFHSEQESPSLDDSPNNSTDNKSDNNHP